MNLACMRLGSYQTNCYVVWADGAKTCIVIDPGYQPEDVLEQIRGQGVQVEAILLTHGHFDHVGGVKKIREETGCKVYICAEDLMLNPQLTAGAIDYTDTYEEGDTLELAGLTFEVLQTPGHTPGCVCLLCRDCMFSGDTLFAGTCGRTDLPGSDPKKMRQSLARLAGLDQEYQVLPGHGGFSTLSEEKRSNPFLQGL